MTRQIQWSGKVFDGGISCGIMGEWGQHRTACKLGAVSNVTPEKIIEGAQKIEFAIRLQLEAAEKKAEASKLPGLHYQE